MLRVLLVLALLPVLAHAAPADRALLDKWIASQEKIQTLSADFTQTRKLLSVKNPLSSSGHLWFRKPDAFRWELGSPAKRIALRNGSGILLAEPRASAQPNRPSRIPRRMQVCAIFSTPRSQ